MKKMKSFLGIFIILVVLIVLSASSLSVSLIVSSGLYYGEKFNLIELEKYLPNIIFFIKIFSIFLATNILIYEFKRFIKYKNVRAFFPEWKNRIYIEFSLLLGSSVIIHFLKIISLKKDLITMLSLTMFISMYCSQLFSFLKEIRMNI
ncbi:hypothetical protein A2U04_05475 [Fusobacterium necrophorum subsp. funduliforme]|uniref:hypothetical protein n=1 Tax=Fusobacterium necrophorum TaxID=859 RepID=UPI000787C201|nr:hypothetical protein [Fusobacterium necrophorum]KYM48176.1 hypothetical protein A2U04_05475 [Fusobacterium necrophorum subsp. funduliforme]